jgi:hypothetical protein
MFNPPYPSWKLQAKKLQNFQLIFFFFFYVHWAFVRCGSSDLAYPSLPSTA